jgi:hypothetical protein
MQAKGGQIESYSGPVSKTFSFVLQAAECVLSIASFAQL